MGIGAAVFESAGKRSTHYVPGVYTRNRSISNPSGISSGNLCIIGQSAGGEPFKLLSFSSIEEAKGTLVSGNLLKAITYAFNCPADGLVPTVIYAMRINNASNSSVTLKDDSGVDTLKISSSIYGSQANQIKIYIAAGTSKGKKVTLEYNDESYSEDNIERQSFNVANVGELGQSLVIANSKVTLKWTPEDGAEKTLALDFDSYPTISELVGAINNTGVFSAEVLDSRVSASSYELDEVSYSSITETITLYANGAAQKEFIESVSFVKECTVISNRSLANVSGEYFTGGDSAEATTTSLSAALSVLETEDIQIIATPETDISVAVAISEHCTSMSNVNNRKERTCFLGGSAGMTDDKAIENAKLLNSALASYVVDNCKVLNPLTSTVETISGAMVGCILAAMESAVAVNVPLTKKALSVLSVTKKRTISNMNTLIQNGIMVVNPDPENTSKIVCIRGLTTYQDDDLINCERSMTREALFMARDLRQKNSGKIGDVSTGSSLSDVVQTLRDAGREWASKGYIIPSGSENVWDIKASIDGDKIILDYSVYLAAPVNFIFITANNHVYSASVTL